jgi:deoxycytidylate deaminase
MLSYLNLAKSVSKLSDHRVKVGAVIVKKKPIVACSNKNVTHPLYADPSKGKSSSLHAEIRCIIHSRCDLVGSDIYVYRETKDGNYALARPCKVCLQALKEAGIRKIFYTIKGYPYYKEERL